MIIWVPLAELAPLASRHRPDPSPRSRLPDGTGTVPPLRADRTASYAAFLLPAQSNSSALSPPRQESQSRTPHTVMPVQRETARHARVTVA